VRRFVTLKGSKAPNFNYRNNEIRGTGKYRVLERIRLATGPKVKLRVNPQSRLTPFNTSRMIVMMFMMIGDDDDDDDEV
jgi:hypothetical protein